MYNSLKAVHIVLIVLFARWCTPLKQFFAKGQEEWYCVEKEYICCSDDIPVNFY